MTLLKLYKGTLRKAIAGYWWICDSVWTTEPDGKFRQKQLETHNRYQTHLSPQFNSDQNRQEYSVWYKSEPLITPDDKKEMSVGEI